MLLKKSIKKRRLPLSFNKLKNKSITSSSSLKFRNSSKLIDHSESYKNTNNIFVTKSNISPNYYKDPFFLNEINLNTQLNILRAIEREKLTLNKNATIDTNKETLPSLYDFKLNSYYKNDLLENDDFYYKTVFKMKPLFRKIRPIVDNKLNMRYAENEEQYRNIIEKEKKILLSQGKRVKNKNVSEHINIKMNEIKKRIRFMKGVMDFTYPGFVLTKIRAIDRQLKREDDIHNKLHEYHCPVEVRNLSKTKRNNDRRKYLFECFHIKTETLK